MEVIVDIDEKDYADLKRNENLIRMVAAQGGNSTGLISSLAILNGTCISEREIGDWIWDNKSFSFKCSKCGYSTRTNYKFCVCGAYMRGYKE